MQGGFVFGTILDREKAVAREKDQHTRERVSGGVRFLRK